MQSLSFRLRCKLSPPPSTTLMFNNNHQFAIMLNVRATTMQKTMKKQTYLPPQQQNM
ncbi:hypothetical protein DY000_02020109 [Brassica cretica]|uniref:Uncharacterized protein n=1 Tax=Brassica cretica TaxID=69181 RepID=A0ABQ7E5Y5_BRACR|nr:hypothetical protein DY000_02020109 [Brassica cretica]